MEVPANSPAVNAGSNEFFLETDQFGSVRVFGGAADIGAFEQTNLPVPEVIAFSSTKNDKVTVVDAATGDSLFTVNAFGGNKAITKGVTVATGDVTGDGIPDLIVGATASKLGPMVKVFDGVSHAEIAAFAAFEPTFKGGVYVSAGDLDGDGRGEIVVGSGAGRISGPNVKAFTSDGTELGGFSPYGFASTSGARVAVGDVTGDGRADIITGPDKGNAGAHVKVFSGATGAEIDSFLAYATGFTKGVYVAAGDVDGDGIAGDHHRPRRGSPRHGESLQPARLRPAAACPGDIPGLWRNRQRRRPRRGRRRGWRRRRRPPPRLRQIADPGNPNPQRTRRHATQRPATG